MPIDDLWYRKERGPDNERLKSRRHGRGKRWRVRYTDAAGASRECLFERKTDAEAFDLAARTGRAPEAKLDQADRHITFPAYAGRWREARVITWAPETRRRIESNIRLHLAPAFRCSVRAITQTDVLL